MATIYRRRVLQWFGLSAFTAAGTAQEDLTIAVGVKLMLLHASVRDRQGRPVSGLRKTSASLRADGPQEIREVSQEDIPVVMGLVIHNSVR